jgi:dihydrofolate synthase/folylpolyglutamate synthase
MDYKTARAKLEQRQEARIELGLDRVRAHLKRLGDPHLKLPAIHVAGTNGKGSVCAILDAVLRTAGYRTGRYNSPHLFDVRERITVDGRWISKKDFGRLMNRTLRADPKKRLTYFELLTSVAFQYFAEKKVDVAVLETGLGGRLDATNVVEAPLASVISTIGMDHMQFLGDTLAKIAAEKAGIIKKGCPVFCSRLPPAALRVVRQRAAVLKAPLSVCRKPWKSVRVDWARNAQVFKGPRGALSLHLLGRGQAANLDVAYQVLEGLRGILPVGQRAWREGLARVSWPGRFEVRRLKGRTLILDGAHNPEAMQNLAATWKRSPWSRRASTWIMGVMRDKDVEGLLKPAAPFLRDVVVVRPPSPRALEPMDLARGIRALAPKAHVSVESDPRMAVGTWLKSPGPRTAVVCGSFYLVGSVADLLGGHEENS